jgi:hypothetical protein
VQYLGVDIRMQVANLPDDLGTDWARYFVHTSSFPPGGEACAAPPDSLLLERLDARIVAGDDQDQKPQSGRCGARRRWAEMIGDRISENDRALSNGEPHSRCSFE